MKDALRPPTAHSPLPGWLGRHRLLLALLVLALLRGLVYLALLPPWQHYDEPTHFEYVQLIAERKKLPQLFNILKGEMSLIGPRPEIPALVERYEPWQRKRFAVPQGITGWWQVNGRSDKPMHLHTEEDLFYIQNYSLLLDVQILWKTAGAVIKRRGAY